MRNRKRIYNDFGSEITENREELDFFDKHNIENIRTGITFQDVGEIPELKDLSFTYGISNPLRIQIVDVDGIAIHIVEIKFKE